MKNRRVGALLTLSYWSPQLVESALNEKRKFSNHGVTFEYFSSTLLPANGGPVEHIYVQALPRLLYFIVVM
uniref:Putative secreted protein n=1 Tax=Ixodes ricinus TaxID=34613 RepID=A0A6B0TTV2_IXORI